MGKVVVFSAISGRVLRDGKPVVGATIERAYHWVWGNERGNDSTQTGPGGEFSFPRIERRMLLGSILPHQPVIDQDLTIHHDGRSYEAWRYTRMTYLDHGELHGRPLRLVCRLEAEPQAHPGDYYGICELE